MNLYYKFENSDAEIKATSTVEVFKEPQLKDNYRYIHTVILEDLEFGSYSYYVSVPKENKTWYSFDVFDASKEKVLSKIS